MKSNVFGIDGEGSFKKVFLKERFCRFNTNIKLVNYFFIRFFYFTSK